MNQTQITTTASSIPAIIFALLAILVVWHWMESGEGIGTGFKMAVQDVKVTFSCRSLDTISRFVVRPHEDYLLDKQAFDYPSWKHLVCHIYDNDSFRSETDRNKLLVRQWTKIPPNIQQRISLWASDQGDPYDKLWGFNIPKPKP